MVPHVLSLAHRTRESAPRVRGTAGCAMSATLDEIVNALGALPAGDGYTARCPAHEDHDPSLSIGERDGRVLVHCHAGCAQDVVLDALAARGLDVRNGHDRHDAPEAHPKLGRPTAVYDYHDRAGLHVGRVMRFDSVSGKKISQASVSATGWTWHAMPSPRPLYRLRDLIARPDAPVLVTEGEKAADAARKLWGHDYVCTTWAGGAKAVAKSDWRALDGRSVTLWPDHDEPGREAMRAVAAAVRGQVRLFDPGALGIALPPGWDAADLLADRDFDLEAVDAAIRSAPRYAAHPAHSGEASIDGAVLLADTEAFLGRFVAYPSAHARIAHVLWIAHTHAMDAWESTPRIAFLSPEPGSGKTRALEVSELLVPRPVEAINATPAYLFRKVSDPDGPPTILFDEIDTLFGARAKEHEEIRGILNAGHRRGAMAGRCVLKGKTVETEELPAYCAVALAGLGNLPDTILTRSLIVRMRRRAPTETIEPYRRRVHAVDGHALRDRLSAWMTTLRAALADARPDMPAGVEDRAADVWEALLAIADAAGGDWPTRARVASVTLVTDAQAASPSLGILLLADLRTVFGDLDAVRTEDVLAALVALEESPWSDLRGKPLDSRRLATYLRPYDVHSRLVRIGATVARGYQRMDLHDAWVRYLSPLPPIAIATYPSVTSVTKVTPTVRCGDCANYDADERTGYSTA
jgi:Protein of unknown function (DUF3631)